MAKKLTVLLVFLFVLMVASVTAFADETGSTTPEAGFTKDEIAMANEVDDQIDVAYLEGKYGDIFFGDNVSTEKTYISIKYLREKDNEHELRYNFTGSTKGAYDSKIVMLMYIKIDGKYVPLTSVDTGSNATEGTLVTCLKVDLEYLGLNKVNEVRVIAFKKSDLENLSLGNIQIEDRNITVRPWTVVEKAIIQLTNIIEDITSPSP